MSLRLARSLAGLSACALIASTAGSAEAAVPSAKVRSISAPPKTALAPGAKLTVSGRLTNQTRRDAKARVTLTLRKSKTGRAISLGARNSARVKAGRTIRYSLSATLPKTLADGTYYLRGCARTGSRAASCRYATRKLKIANPKPAPAPTPLPAPGPATGPRFDVLAFGPSGPGVEALQAFAKAGGFKVTQTDDPAVFKEARLKRFRAVVLLGDIGSPLTEAQEAAFEAYFKDGGGLLAVGSAIESEPQWGYLTELLGTRADGAAVAAGDATIKVADRGHEASKSLPEYWTHSDRYYNFKDNVRGRSHVLATVDETTYSGGTMKALADHPVAWCKDFQGGRSFYTNVGANGDFSGADVRRHLAGALQWTAGEADPVYSDCGATVLANYEQVKLSDNTVPGTPGLQEPIGFDLLPDGRMLQTARSGELRLHDPEGGSSTVIAKLDVYTNSEDGLYGPAVDNDFASNKWVYLYYAPKTVVNVKQSDGTTKTITTPPNASAPTAAPSLSAWDPYVGYFQLSRFKFVEDASGPHLDLGSEQKILRVTNNRGACCHVAGDIDFDKHNNLWLVTGDDTPSGGGNSGGFSPHNDMKTDETQTVRPSGPFTLTFDGQTTAELAADATPAAVQSALEALSNIEPGDVIVTAGPNVQFDGRYAQRNVAQMTATGATVATSQEGDWFQAPFVDARRSAGNTNDLRGKVLRIHVNADGSYTSPAGNLFPEAQDTDDRSRPEIYAMGFRNPFRIQVDDHDVAYVTDYSPDSNTPETYRGPAGTGRVEVVRKASNYGWPLCYSPNLPYYRWNFNTSKPLDPTPEAYECGNPDRGPQNRSRWNTGQTIDPASEPGRVDVPAISRPDIWYSYRDNANPPLGTPCLASYDKPGGGTCPQLFPELYTTGVAPHGAAPYRYDASNPDTGKFPPYYDGAFVLGEFNADTLREVRFDANTRIFKINRFLDCGAALSQASPFPFECDNPMDMQFGADGRYYLLTYGDGFFASNPDAGLYRWTYVKGRRAPVAVMSATPTNGVAPLTVQFSSEGSRDPDPGDSIRFAWDFDGDGTVDSTDPNPVHTYTANDQYKAKLTITDSSGTQTAKELQIIVGNTAPTISITTPVDGDFFEWGDSIPFTVTASDPEDGPIDCSRVTVTFVLVHNTHGHAEEAKTGCSGTLQTLAEDASHGDYIAGGISATYTDKGANGQPALTATAQHVVQLRRQQVEYALEQEGTSTTASSDTGGGQVRNSLDPGDWIAINRNVNLAHMDKKITLRFTGPGSFPPFIPVTPAGTELADVEVRDGSPTGPVLTTVRLKATGDLNTYQDFSAPLDFIGSKRLYLVFKQLENGPVIPFIGWGNLNWVSFSGPGVKE